MGRSDWTRDVVVEGWELTLRARPVGPGFAPDVAPGAAYAAGGRAFDVFGFALADLYDGTAFYPDPMACLDALEAQVRAAIAARRGGR